MRLLIAAAALAALIAAPIIAVSGPAEAKTDKSHASKTHVTRTHVTRTYATRHSVGHGRIVRAVRPVRLGPPPFSPYVHRPEYDVYVDGEYAGSDPDPRIRETIRREWQCDQMFNRC